jgi:LPS O-antigen subunit length determinant protein (WzzB/FepE family)
MPNQNKNDEIDVTDLVVKSINSFKKNFWMIAVFVGLGIAGGVAYYALTTKVYESKMIISSKILTESYCQTLFSNANRYIIEGNVQMAAKQLHISESTAAKIVSLEVTALTKAQSADSKESERFLITAEVLDREILAELQKGIIAYLESNDFAKIRVEQNKTYFKQMIATVDKEIADMEEFKTRIFKGDFFQNAKGNVMFDPTTVNTKILELTEKKISFQNSLEIANSVELIDGFTQFQKQARPKLSLSVTSGLVVGLVLAGAILLVRYLNRLTIEGKSVS